MAKKRQGGFRYDGIELNDPTIVNGYKSLTKKYKTLLSINLRGKTKKP